MRTAAETERFYEARCSAAPLLHTHATASPCVCSCREHKWNDQIEKQAKMYDAEGEYVRHWLPELAAVSSDALQVQEGNEEYGVHVCLPCCRVHYFL